MNYSMILAAAISILVAGHAAAADITVDVTKLRNANGKFAICLWKDGANFPACDQFPPFRKVEAAAKDAAKPIVIKDVPDGVYALSGYHDESGAGKLERNYLGVPSFGVALRPNGFPWPIGRPSWDGNKFTVKGQNLIFTMEFRYF